MTISRILCVDDHAFVAEGLRARLEQEPDFEFVGHLTRADDLVETTRTTRADIVVLDIDIPGSDVFEALDDLKRHLPDVRAVMLSAFIRDRYIDSAYRAGVMGYLSKSDPPHEIIEGLRAVARNEPAFSPQVVQRSQPPKPGESPRPNRSRLATLTRRETQILRMIARGLGRTKIASDICRSPLTVDNHRKSIMKKLCINDRGELVRFAIGEGLVEV